MKNQRDDTTDLVRDSSSLFATADRYKNVTFKLLSKTNKNSMSVTASLLMLVGEKVINTAVAEVSREDWDINEHNRVEVFRILVKNLERSSEYLTDEDMSEAVLPLQNSLESLL